MYIFTLYRARILNVFVQDHQAIKVEDSHLLREHPVKRVLIRYLVNMFMAPLSLPMLLIKLSDVGSPIIVMFTNVIIPSIFAAGFLVLGLYDMLVQYFYAKLTGGNNSGQKEKE